MQVYRVLGLRMQKVTQSNLVELFPFLITYAQIPKHINMHIETHRWAKRNILSLCIKLREPRDDCEIKEEHPVDDRLEPRSKKIYKKKIESCGGDRTLKH